MSNDQTTRLTANELRGAAKVQHGVSHGGKLCGYCEKYIPAGDPLYWPSNPSSEYDDTDPVCSPCVREINTMYQEPVYG